MEIFNCIFNTLVTCDYRHWFFTIHHYFYMFFGAFLSYYYRNQIHKIIHKIINHGWKVGSSHNSHKVI
jgi:hypothetical protein